MLTIRADQIEALTQVILKRRRREVSAQLAEAYPDWDDVALHVERWFEPLIKSGAAASDDLIRALTLARHYDRDSKEPVHWMLLAVLLRSGQEAAARCDFIERHILPRIVPPSADEA